MAEKYNFFAVDSEEYENNELHNVLRRIDYIVNTYVQEFSSQSLIDWVHFIESFSPSFNTNIRFSQPLIILNLNLEHAVKSKKNPSIAGTEGNIDFKPTISKAHKFIFSSLLS